MKTTGLVTHVQKDIHHHRSLKVRNARQMSVHIKDVLDSAISAAWIVYAGIQSGGMIVHSCMSERFVMRAGRRSLNRTRKKQILQLLQARGE